MTFWPASAWGPVLSIKGFTLPVAVTVAVGALALDILHSLALHLDVQF